MAANSDSKDSSMEDALKADENKQAPPVKDEINGVGEDTASSPDIAEEGEISKSISQEGIAIDSKNVSEISPDATEPGASEELHQEDNSDVIEASSGTIEDDTVKHSPVDGDNASIVSEQQNKDDNKNTASLDPGDGGCTSDNHLNDAQTEPQGDTVAMATSSMPCDDTENPIPLSETSDVPKKDHVDATKSSVSQSSCELSDPNDQDAGNDVQIATTVPQTINADKTETESPLATDEESNSGSDSTHPADLSKTSMPLSDDPKPTPESPDSDARNNGCSNLSSESGREVAAKETIPVADANGGVDTEKVKDHVGNEVRSADVPNSNHNQKEVIITEPVKPLLIFPNPVSEEDEKRSAETFSSANDEIPKADLQTEDVTPQLDSANENNNAKGQSLQPNQTEKAGAKSNTATNGKETGKTGSLSPERPGQDSKDRTGKSYSAQRSASRGTRGKGEAPDPKSPVKHEALKMPDRSAKSDSNLEKNGPDEAAKLRDKGKQAADHGREKMAGNRPRDADRESERRYADKRRERDGKDKRPQDPTAVTKKPAKTREELEKEEAERKKREEERRKMEEEKKAAEMKRQEEEEQVTMATDSLSCLAEQFFLIVDKFR